jgi:tetratricopeptide (TPR) repeat protein
MIGKNTRDLDRKIILLVACIASVLTALSCRSALAIVESLAQLEQPISKIIAVAQDVAPSIRDLTRSAIQKRDKGDYQGALSDLDKAIAINPNDYWAYVIRGWIKLSPIQDYQGSLADFDRAIAINPTVGTAYNGRGRVKHEKKDYQGALADFDRAIAIDPNDAIAYNDRALTKIVYLQGGFFNRHYDYEGALMDYTKAISLAPNDATIYWNRGILKYANLYDRSGGIEDVRTAARLYNQQGDQERYWRANAQLRRWRAL